MRLRIYAAALLIVGLALGLTLSSGCTTQSQQQATGPDPAPTDEMPPADEEMTQHHEEHAEHGHEMGEHHQAMEHHGDTPRVHDRNLQLSGEMQDGVRVVEVAARRYKFDPETIVLKKGQPTRLLITSEDVTHGFDIEGMDIDVKLPPHQTQTVELTPEQAGEHHFHCSVYCGPGHDQMHGTIVVRE